MAIFLAKFSLSTRDSLLDNLEKFYRYLPRKPLRQNTYKYGTNEVVVFKFNAALDREENFRHPDELILCHGYGDSFLEERIRTSFKNGCSLGLKEFPEAFCAIRLTNYSIEFGSSSVGIDPLFFYEDNEQLIVTNRHNLLGYWLSFPTLRKNALAWTVGRNHIGDFGTYWNEIKRTRPGNLYRKHVDLPIFEVKMNCSGMYEPIKDEQIGEYIDDISNVFENIINFEDKQLQFLLSGGKDSRAIVGLLTNTERFKEMSFSTFGEKFQPDIMSAMKVAKELGVIDSYKTYRSPIEEPTVNIVREVAKDLCADSSGSSLADLRSILFSDSLIIGGHESGFKSPVNTKKIAQYLDSRRYWVDGLGFLNANTYNELNDWYRGELKEILDGIPQSRYSQMDAIFFRVGTYLSGSQVNTHVSRSEMHPFLDGRMVKLALGVSDQALESQLIHYIMMRRSSAILEKIPFANDKWPKSTQYLANKINLPFRMEPELPYQFQKYFPSSKVFGGYSWRIQLIEQTKNFVHQYLLDNKVFFDFINYDQIHFFFQKDIKTLNITEIYHHLSLLKVCLVHFFYKGKELFDFTLEETIENKLIELFHLSRINPSANSEHIIKAYKAKLDSYEESIANMAERDRISDQEQDSFMNARIAGKLCEILSFDKTVLYEKLKELKFFELSKECIFIGKMPKNVKLQVRGFMLIPSLELNRALIAVRNVSKEFPLEGFIYSESGFWFKYFNTTFDDPEVNIIIPSSSVDGELWIMPWYAESSIWVSKFSVTTL